MKPVLTPKRLRGLQSIRALVRVELDAGDRGAFDPSNGASKSDTSDVEAALKWLDAVIRERSKP